MPALKIVFWTSLVLLVWTHVGYPLAAALAARLRRRRVESSAIEPTVSIVVAAHNEEDVVGAARPEPARARLSRRAPGDPRRPPTPRSHRTDEIVARLAAEDDRP